MKRKSRIALLTAKPKAHATAIPFPTSYPRHLRAAEQLSGTKWSVGSGPPAPTNLVKPILFSMQSFLCTYKNFAFIENIAWKNEQNLCVTIKTTKSLWTQTQGSTCFSFFRVKAQGGGHSQYKGLTPAEYQPPFWECPPPSVIVEPEANIIKNLNILNF